MLPAGLGAPLWDTTMLRAVAGLQLFKRTHTRVYPGRMPGPVSPGQTCSPRFPNTSGLRPEEEWGLGMRGLQGWERPLNQELEGRPEEHSSVHR